MEREGLREKGLPDTEYAERLQRVNDEVADLARLRSEARQAAKDAESKWRRAMVQHLLLPIEDVPSEAFECSILRALPVFRRAEEIHHREQYDASKNSEESDVHWALVVQSLEVKRQIRSWQLLRPQTVTEADIHERKLKELENELAELNLQMGGIGTKRNDAPQPALEDEAQRQRRRLGDLRRFGGDWIKRGGSWAARDRLSGAFTKLVEQEKSNGSINSSEKSVRRDLGAAAAAEADAKRNGRLFGQLTNP